MEDFSTICRSKTLSLIRISVHSSNLRTVHDFSFIVTVFSPFFSKFKSNTVRSFLIVFRWGF